MFAQAGRPWILFDALLVAALSLVNLWTGWEPALYLASVAVAVLFLFLIFFRDPERTVASGIVAPADGRVLRVAREGTRIRVATFMNVTNVHVNRVPFQGYLLRVDDRGGPKRPAFSPEASGNAQKRYLCVTPIGLIEVVQITGLVARRCVSYLPDGSPLRRGERFGMILFGSRVDVVLPADRVRVTVKVGQKVHAGTTSLAVVQ